ncbi:MAG TPA: carotenoid biosynthesis protein [Pseudonocardiaceae bacterium]
MTAYRGAWVLGAGAVACQLAFPFLGTGPPLLTVVTVVLFCAAVLVHAAATRGPAAAVTLLVVAGGLGLAVEAVGVRTGMPFGAYSYADRLGPAVLGVPAVVPLAWTMMAYPALLAGRRLTTTTAGTALVGGWALASWDVFLDPQMVDAGHWAWRHPEPSLPGVDGVPLTNFAGWLLVSVAMVGLLGRLLPGAARPETTDRLPAALYLWTYGSSVLAHLAFFGRPGVALAGGVLMGLVAVPFAASLVLRRRSPQAVP